MAYPEAYEITPSRGRSTSPLTGPLVTMSSSRTASAFLPRRATSCLACSPPSLGAKLGTVVDEDIDVFDPSQAEWAVNTGPDRPFRAVPTGTLP